MFLLVKYLVNQDVKIGYEPQQSAVGHAVGESAARENQNEVCRPHYLVIPGIVVAGAVNKYQVHRIGVLENDVGGEARAIAFAQSPDLILIIPNIVIAAITHSGWQRR